MNKIKQFLKNDHADSYVIFYTIFAFLIFGGIYAIMSDVRDSAAPIYNELAPLGNEFNDADSQEGYDFLNMLFSFSIVFFLMGIVLYGYIMAQKPGKQW